MKIHIRATDFGHLPMPASASNSALRYMSEMRVARAATLLLATLTAATALAGQAWLSGGPHAAWGPYALGLGVALLAFAPAWLGPER